jgi:putative mycofactocin binding protein MftB
MECAGSTEPPRVPPVRAAVGFNPEIAYELHPQVALRPEPFGALAYHYGNRRLTFLRSHELVELVKILGEHDCAASAMRAAGIEESRRRPVESALASLEASGVVRAR